MRIASTAELKNKTNELVHHAMGGEPVVITLRGRPAAALVPLSEQETGRLLLHKVFDRDLPPQTAQWRYASVPSPLGTVYAAYSERGVAFVDLAPNDQVFERTFQERFQRDVVRDPAPPKMLIRHLTDAVTSRRAFPGPLDLSFAGPFERRVLEQLRRIPKGEVRTYREIAERLGHPGATRAVGNACARNPVPLLIPCHRVVRSDGGLGGYSLRGGPNLKRALLRQEGVDLRRLAAR